MNDMKLPPEDYAGAERLPVDLGTLARGVWKCRWLLLLWALVSAALGVGLALSTAPQFWNAESVLLYQPPSDELMAGMYRPPSIQTQLNMVKVKPNLAETRMRLKLPCTLDKLGASCRIKNPRDSQLLVCEVSWHSPEHVAEIANTLTDVFIQRQQRLRRMELAAVIREMESRLSLLKQKLEQSGDANQSAQLAQDRELESYRNRINTADEMYEKALTELKAVQRQLADLAQMEEELRGRLLAGEGSNSQSETMSSLNIRVERIREKIHDLRMGRINDLTAEQWEDRIKFSQRMLSHGFISQQAYEHELAELEKHRANAEDSEEIQALKRELENLYARMRPNSPEGVEATPLMQALAIERYGLMLQHSAAQERVVQLERSRVRLDQQYREAMRSQPSRQAFPEHLIESWTSESQELAEALAKVRAIADSPASDFGYVSRAARPTRPARSYRKLICIGVTGFLTALGTFAVILWQLLNRSLRSGADAQLKLRREHVSVLPELDDEGDQESLDEQVRALAERVRSVASGRGARVLVASVAAGEGRSMLARHLARCVARRGETAVVLDASVRRDPVDQPGLTDYLDQSQQDLSRLIEPGEVTGVFHIGRGTRQVMPDLLASTRMSSLLDELSEMFDVVVIDGPPAELNADADITARYCDGLLMVVQADRMPSHAVRRVTERLEDAGAPLLSVVLNRTDPVFLNASL